ncbi:MAG: hypothetical protein F9K40_14840 [Kofleriaceae bacterium]|nr:MAG: hypothetical protein F9K40_14840 [Kofleriaceae bacterium]MBZ0234339.1 hypothetical protein [Kofleriaceae bacterium]
MRLHAVRVLAALLLASCSSSKAPDRASAGEPVVLDTRTMQMAIDQSVPELAVIQSEANRQIGEALVKAWLTMIEQGRRDAAVRELASAQIRIDADCGDLPACAVDRIAQILSKRPGRVTYRPVTTGDVIWVNVAATEFAEPDLAGAEIMVRLAFSSEGDVRFEELGVAVTSR